MHGLDRICCSLLCGVVTWSTKSSDVKRISLRAGCVLGVAFLTACAQGAVSGAAALHSGGPDIRRIDFLNSVMPSGACGDKDEGWPHTAFGLSNGEGPAAAPTVSSVARAFPTRG
jgi:hypothetical protein